MKSFLVIGMGRFGTAVAQELTELGQEVLAIDENVESVQRIADDVTQVMQGDAQDEAVLGAIGVRNFDCCIVAVGTDMEASILITVMLKDLGAQYIIAKARKQCACQGARARRCGPCCPAGERNGLQAGHSAWHIPTWWILSACRTNTAFWRYTRRKAGSADRLVQLDVRQKLK